MERNGISYHTQRVQRLEILVYQAFVSFILWFLQQTAVEPDFSVHVLFKDKCTFT